MTTTAHIDTFARDNLPPREQWPDLVFELPELQYPERMNCAVELVDRAIEAGGGARTAIVAPGGVRWTYADLAAQASRIAHVLVEDMGLVPGNRVLLRAPNNPMMAACWLAVVRAGAIAVGTMPLLRAKELCDIIGKAQISHALCDARLVDELDTAPDDTCTIAFTSGTTGKPKGTMHFHRDVMAACDCWPKSTLRASPDDLFTGSPPLAFTFGLGGLLLFPLRIGASTLLIERPTPDALLGAIAEHKASVLFTAPTSYRAMAAQAKAMGGQLATLRKCVSAGEALPAATRALWKDATGIEIIDGIGATEMLHIFISHDALPIPGYRA